MTDGRIASPRRRERNRSHPRPPGLPGARRHRRLSPPTGVSAVEVVFALGLVAAVLIPIVTQSHAHLREAYVLEYHVAAQRRAQALLAILLTQDMAALESKLRSGATTGPGGVRAVRLPVTMPPETLADLGYSTDLESRPQSRQARDRLFRDEAFLEWTGPSRDDDTLMFQVRACVTWTFPGDTVAREHRYELSRVVRRPGLSHMVLPALPEAPQ